MCFGVVDVEATLSLVEKFGGKVERKRRLEFPISENVTGLIVYCEDCAGNPLELVEHRDAAAAGSHASLFGLKEFGWGNEAPGNS
jgi:hypothetical protein